MTAARIARRQARQPVERSIVGFLLLHRIEYTNERPWFGFVGAAVTGLIFAVIKEWLL